MKSVITCVVCPVSCPVEVEYHEHEIDAIDRNQCKLALDYVRTELFDPRRTLTTSIAVEGGDLPLLSVKTDRPVPKDKVSAVQREVQSHRVMAPVSIGDVVIPDVLGTGANVVATRSIARR